MQTFLDDEYEGERFYTVIGWFVSCLGQSVTFNDLSQYKYHVPTELQVCPNDCSEFTSAAYKMQCYWRQRDILDYVI